MTRARFAALVLVALAPRAYAQAPGPHGEDEVVAEDPPPSAPDDLAKAADATAEVAAIPAQDPAAAPPSQQSSDDIDLASLGLDPTASTFDDKLNIYGFADFNYAATHFSRDPMIFPQDMRGFTSGNLNLYLAKNLTAKARMLAEVRFTFLPNGTVNADGSVVETAAQDPANYQRIAHWGGIVIERAYAEYDLTDRLTLRGGRWLSPYGIWNIDHGSPTITGTSRPYVIGEQSIPEHQTGLDLFGSYDVDRFRFTAHVTASNGRGPTEAQIDQDNKLAFGGSVKLETPWGLKVGGSYYRGRYTGLPASAGALAETYLEEAYAGDAQLDLGALHIQAEVIARDRHYVAGQRFATPAGFAPDSRELGVYVLAGYRFDRLWNVMPYIYGEDNRPADPSLASTVVQAVNPGLNFRPAPSLVFKLQGTFVWFSDDNSGLFSGANLKSFNAQVSWVF